VHVRALTPFWQSAFWHELQELLCARTRGHRAAYAWQLATFAQVLWGRGGGGCAGCREPAHEGVLVCM